MQPRFLIVILPLETQVLHRAFMAQRFDPVLPHGVAVGERVQDGWIFDALRAAPGFVAGLPDDVAVRVGQFPRRAEVVCVVVQRIDSISYKASSIAGPDSAYHCCMK